MSDQNNYKKSDLTYGQKAVGVTFNPSKDPLVDKFKELYANIIDLCNDSRNVTHSQECKRLFSLAITKAQDAQMWAVKAQTWQDS